MELQLLNARVQEKQAPSCLFLRSCSPSRSCTRRRAAWRSSPGQEDWRGRPVQVGERVMLIADPSLIDVTIYLPPDDAVELEPGAQVNLLLHVDPLSPLEAKIERSSYEATLAPDGTLAYVIRAQLGQGQGLPRIGLRGTAKIYAGRVTLAYYLLRKPLAFLRRSLGI